MAAVIIPYKPRYPEVHKILERYRFVVLVAHRRFGKTVLSVNHLIKSAIMCQKERGSFAYVSPLRNQAKQIAWNYLKHYTSVLPNTKCNEAELTITLCNGAVIRIFGADNPDALRGMYYDGIVLDEVAQMKAEVWGEIVQPALADRQGFALFIGTPKGINLFSELYYGALEKMSQGSDEWYALSFPVTKTSAIAEKEVDRLRSELSDNEFRQEMLCDFSASSDNTLITIDEATAAGKAEVDPAIVAQYPLVVGVDVARFGSDNTVFFARRGKMAYKPVVLHGLNNVDVAHRLVAFITEKKPAYVFIDAGQGSGVIDLTRDLTVMLPCEIVEIPFGSKANDAAKFMNRRAEMWYRMREWIKEGGVIPDDPLLIAELSAPVYMYTVSGQIKLEPKEDIKERLRRSCDLADALALTFAVSLPVQNRHVLPELDAYGERSAGRIRDWLTTGEWNSEDNERQRVLDWG